ncbi:hypothetical protein SAMN04488482_5653 [Pseudomonas chlororaphis]|nr:hypothetical protein SAMN04488482_5653 [Pseudomonas chlororaphis]
MGGKSSARRLARLLTVQGSVRKVGERRSGKAKTGEEAECRGLHEHSEPVFNAA